MNYKKITIVGCSSMGKTTLANQLGNALDLKVVDLDEYFWRPNWQESEKEDFRQRVLKAIDCERWVCSGNYTSRVQTDIMDKADLIIWLDYPFPITFYRVFTRTMKRIFSGESICNGNYESLYKQFCTKDSILLWVIKMHRSYHNQFTILFSQKKFKNRDVLHFDWPGQTSSFLEKISIKN